MVYLLKWLISLITPHTHDKEGKQGKSFIVRKALENGLVVPAFNIPHPPMLKAIVQAVVDENSVAMIQVARLEWEKFEAGSLENIADEYAKYAVEGHTLTVDLMGRTLKHSIPRLRPEVLLEKLTAEDLDSTALPKVSSPKDREGRMARIQGHLTALFRLADLPPEEKRLLSRPSESYR